MITISKRTLVLSAAVALVLGLFVGAQKGSAQSAPAPETGLYQISCAGVAGNAKCVIIETRTATVIRTFYAAN